MKVFIKNLVLTLFSAGLIFSCESIELDLTANPNGVSPDQATPDFYLNGIQEEFARFAETFGTNGAEVTRIGYMGNRLYDQAYSPASQDGEWRNAYSSILTDIHALYPLAEEGNLKRHLGMAQVMEAFTIVTLVDFYGDVPYTEAVLGTENFNPIADSGASIYSAALTLLNSAIANFNSTDNATNPGLDYYYAGDWEKWTKLANSLKIKIYAQTRLVDSGAVAAINTIVASGDYLTEVEDDFQFTWATNVVNPDSRHPKYAGNYTSTGAGAYMSNWLMNYMDNDKVGNTSAIYEGADPRIRYYFYRQEDCTPGNGCDPNQQELSCSVEPAPAHYVDGGFTFCNLPNGYWGRDHGDDDGIPPDSNKRTTYGVYPAGGQFDDSSFSEVDLGTGGGGAGITPIFLAQTIDFLRAELAYEANDLPTAKSLMLDGIEKSITKVQAFGALDAAADASLAPLPEDVEDYIAEVEALYDAATGDDKFNILAKEFFVSQFGNGIDAYNFYRRTGFPSDLQPNLEPNPGAFIRSFLLPAVYANNNSNATQKPNVTTKVFWDTNPDSGFPLSN